MRSGLTQQIQEVTVDWAEYTGIFDGFEVRTFLSCTQMRRRGSVPSVVCSFLRVDPVVDRMIFIAMKFLLSPNSSTVVRGRSNFYSLAKRLRVNEKCPRIYSNRHSLVLCMRLTTWPLP